MILLIALYFSLFLLHNLGDRWIEYFIDAAISFRANGVMGCGYMGGVRGIRVGTLKGPF